MRGKIVRLVAGLGAVAVIALAGVAASVPWFERTGSGEAVYATNPDGTRRLVDQAWSSAAEVAAPMLMVESWRRCFC